MGRAPAESFFDLTNAGEGVAALAMATPQVIAEMATVTALEQAALDYVAARKRNEAAEPSDWSACAAEVDRTWHALRIAAGYEVADGE